MENDASIDGSGEGLKTTSCFVCVEGDDAFFEIERHKQIISLRDRFLPSFLWFI